MNCIDSELIVLLILNTDNEAKKSAALNVTNL